MVSVRGRCTRPSTRMVQFLTISAGGGEVVAYQAASPWWG